MEIEEITMKVGFKEIGNITMRNAVKMVGEEDGVVVAITTIIMIVKTDRIEEIMVIIKDITTMAISTSLKAKIIQKINLNPLLQIKN